MRPGLNGSRQLERTILAISANLQRKDLGPIEEAETFKKLIDLGMNGNEIAKTIGRSHSFIFSRMRMLKLPVPVQDLFQARKLPIDEGMLNELYHLDAEMQIFIAKRGAKEKLSYKQITGLADVS